MTTKNKVIESLADKAYRDSHRAELSKQFAAIKNDSENISLAEAGIEDWAVNTDWGDSS